MKIQVGDIYVGNGSSQNTPISLVTVLGPATFTGPIKLNGFNLPTTDGSHHNALTTDSHGNLTWSAINVDGQPMTCTTITATGTVSLCGLNYPLTGGNISDRVLQTDGNKTLSWVGRCPSRNIVSLTTDAIDNLNTYEGNLVGYINYALLKITTDTAAWIRIYTDSASQINDRIRSTLDGDGNLPAYQEADQSIGIITEYMTYTPNTLILTPMLVGFNNESTPTTDIKISVTNLSGSSAAITVNLTILKL